MEQSPFILLIDDDPDDRQMFIDEFQRHNADVAIQPADSAEEALAYLLNCVPEDLPMLIVIDYQLPGLFAPAFLQAIKHNSRCDKILKIVWSTSPLKEHIESCMENGAYRYFTKPSELADLCGIIDFITQILQSRLATHGA